MRRSWRPFMRRIPGMLTESEKRAALLAVSRFGADRAKVRLAVQAALQAMAQGKPADLLEILVRENLLTPNQAAELRFSLDKTMVDPASPKVDGEEVKPNGAAP